MQNIFHIPLIETEFVLNTPDKRAIVSQDDQCSLILINDIKCKFDYMFSEKTQQNNKRWQTL